MASAAEAKRTRVAIRKSLLQFKLRYDSYSKQYRKWLNRGPAEEIPKPHKMEQRWVKAKSLVCVDLCYLSAFGSPRLCKSN